jgi:rhodanese-related sulfurtransferase
MKTTGVANYTSSAFRFAAKGLIYMKIMLTCTAVFLVAILSYAGPRSQEGADPANVTCKQAAELISQHKDDKDFVIIDFRPKEMFEQAYLENSFYYDYFSDGVDALLNALDKDKTYLVYCNVGKRSGMALKKMRAMGFEKVYHMYEGIPAWKSKGYKTLSKTE